MSAQVEPRTAAKVGMELVAVGNRSADGLPISALERLAVVHERLPSDCAAGQYIDEHLAEDEAAKLIVSKPDEFRYHVRQARQKLDVSELEPDFQAGGDL